ncbi:MAG: serine/threonine-protein kinase PknG [Acidimicrobiaceae bacterium]|nr:MAG: serine/threonine-protein kinase PknG [Acidimicrobiaceae bacterium]
MQLLGVLREVVATSTSGPVTRSTPSTVFAAPAVAADRLEWSDLPRVLPDSGDPASAWLETITAVDPAVRLTLLASPPDDTAAVAVARAYAALDLGDLEAVRTAADQLLQADPWEWRGVWLHGLAALQAGRADDAVGAFTAGRTRAEARARSGLRARRRLGGGRSNVRGLRSHRCCICRTGVVRSGAGGRGGRPAGRCAQRARRDSRDEPSVR